MDIGLELDLFLVVLFRVLDNELVQIFFVSLDPVETLLEKGDLFHASLGHFVIPFLVVLVKQLLAFSDESVLDRRNITELLA